MTTITCCATCKYDCALVARNRVIRYCSVDGTQKENNEDPYTHVCENWRLKS